MRLLDDHQQLAPPIIPIVFTALIGLKFRFKYILSLFRTEHLQTGCQRLVLQRQDRHGDQAAFFAPLIATVATGTPPGICTIESKESSPFRLEI